MLRFFISALLFILSSPIVGFSQEAEKIDGVIKLMRALCVSGEVVRIETDASGGFSILKKGVGGEFRFSKAEIPAFAEGIQSELMHEEAEGVRECMKPHISKIIDIVFGIQAGTAKPAETFELGPEVRQEGNLKPLDQLLQVVGNLPSDFYNLTVVDVQRGSQHDIQKVSHTYKRQPADDLVLVTLDIGLNVAYVDNLFRHLEPLYENRTTTVDWDSTFFNTGGSQKLFGLTNQNIAEASMLETGGYLPQPLGEWLAAVLQTAVGAHLGCKSGLGSRVEFLNEQGEVIYATWVDLVGFDPDEYISSSKPKAYGIPEIADDKYDLKELPRHKWIYRSWLPYKASSRLSGCHLYLTILSKGPKMRMVLPISVPRALLESTKQIVARAEFSPQQQKEWTKVVSLTR